MLWLRYKLAYYIFISNNLSVWSLFYLRHFYFLSCYKLFKQDPPWVSFGMYLGMSFWVRYWKYWVLNLFSNFWSTGKNLIHVPIAFIKAYRPGYSKSIVKFNYTQQFLVFDCHLVVNFWKFIDFGRDDWRPFILGLDWTKWSFKLRSYLDCLALITRIIWGCSLIFQVWWCIQLN